MPAGHNFNCGMTREGRFCSKPTNEVLDIHGYFGRLASADVHLAGAPQPNASTLNSFDGAVVANAAIVSAGTSGAINV